MMTGVIALVAVSVCIFGCGAMMAFVLSPKNALEWRHIESLPVLDATSYEALKPGDEAAITGTLDGNEPITPDGLVAYEKDQWNVSKSDATSSSSSSPSAPSGSWDVVEINAPQLNLTVSGGAIKTQSASQITVSGDLHEVLQPSKNSLMADYDGKNLPDQSIRLRGFNDGDLLTVVGQKGSTGALIPNRLYGGDRVQLVNEIRQAAQTYFVAGVGAMICSPIVLIVGVTMLFFGRRRGWFGIG